jgi:amino acid adenylation domain-containing protein/thioester reductase-like protein
MTDTPRREQPLSPARRELLRRRLASKSASGPVRAESGSGPYPLSFAQERFWFLDQLEPGSGNYGVSIAGRVTGEIDVQAMQLALADVIARHAALRTTFPSHDGVPSQHVAETGEVDWSELSLTDVAPAERHDALREQARRFHRLGFNLATGPLLRVRLLRFGPNDHGILTCMHHIISDGWSLTVLLQDLPLLYNARVTGAAPELPELPVSYADWAHWQRSRLAGKELEQQLEHWKAALTGAPAYLELPNDMARPPLPSHAGRTLHFELPSELATDLRRLSGKLGATLFVTLLAGFKALLFRITGESDLVLGTSIANRDHAQLRGLIGACLNTLALRTRCEPEHSYAELVAAVKATLRAGLARPELPFEKLVEALQPERDPSHSPVFNVYFDMMVPLPTLDFVGMQIEQVEYERGTSLFDLSLAVQDYGTKIVGALQYNTDLFLPESIERLARHYLVLLRSAVSEPQRPLGELELLGEDERLLFQGWADASQLEHDRRAWVHKQFEAQARKTPDAVALIEGDETTTYAILDRAANTLACRLTGMGAGPDALVGVCLPRSRAVLVAILAVWKAGAVYLPLDPTDPPERLATITDDTRAPVVITLTSLADRFEGLACELLCVDEQLDPASHSELSEPPDIATSGEDLAYVIYTSGSTGEPKGVMISHAALTNHIAWVRHAFDITPADRFVLRTPFSFDASIWEIVHPLVSGASLVVAPPGLQRDPAGLLRLVAASSVSVLQTVPSMLRTWLEEPRFAELTSLRHLICAGEALLPDLVLQFDERCASAGLSTRLHNLYGPSEATIDSTMHSCVRGESADLPGRDSLPIGRPISNTVVHVLDAQKQQVPVGVVGELAISGEGLASGYMNRPDLTRKRFVDNPYGQGRMYLTGDLGRRLADGSLEYVGRIDNQVKVNGYRIELGEIETCLAEHPDVSESAVIADGPAGDQRRLVAYVVPRAGTSPRPQQLRMFLDQRLPRYMLPSTFVSLSEMPHSSSEKLDRRALPRPEALRPDLSESYVGPVTETEKSLSEIMVDLLGIDRVGLHDNFFALGGHSLLATRLASRIRDTLGVEVPLMDFFEQPTVAALTELVEQGHGTANGKDAIVRVSRDGDHPVSFGQQRLWFLSRLEPEATHYHMTGALRLRGTLDVDALQRALDALVARHDALHTVLRWESGSLRQLVLPPEPMLLETFDSTGAVHSIRAQLDELSARPFDLSSGPLLRTRLLRLGPEDHVFAACQHHVVSDARSLQLMVDELGRLYDAFHRGLPDPLPALVVDTIDHAHWQRRRLDPERLATEVAWWQETLAGAPTSLELPTDARRPSHPSHRGHVTQAPIAADLTQGLRRIAREHETTLFVVLLASVAAWLQRLTGADDLVLGSAVDQRTREELQPLLGFFVNILPLRLDLSGDPSFGELVTRARRTVGAALSHRELPFEHLVDQFDSDRDSSRPPLFGMSFDLIDATDISEAFPGLDTAPVDYDPGTAKLDLGLAVEEHGDALTAWIEANADLFERDTVARLWHHWEVLSADLVAHPTRPISAAQLLTDAETAWLLRDCNPPVPLAMHHSSVIERLVAHAEGQPDAAALLCGDDIMSWRELRLRVRDIAGQLAARGIGEGDLIALCLPRSTDLVATLLACWWLGAAWLPLDPADPLLRQARLLSDARARLLVTTTDTADELPCELLQLDRNSVGSEPPAAVQSAPHSTAYVLYTSGSTGAPKGVAVSHGALSQMLSALHELLELRPDDRMLQRIPLSFDAALLELGLPLWAGCAAVIVPADQSNDPDVVAATIEQQDVSVMVGVPSFVGPVLSRLQPGRTKLRVVGCGGEALSTDMPTLVARQLGPQVALYNLYGPTEATVNAMAHRCVVGNDPTAATGRTSLPIGRPLAGMSAYVVDSTGRLVPVGVTGELWLSGPLLADGYLGDPEATASAFSANPFDAGPGSRLYRTGDLVRRNPDGTLVFEARSDLQVKVAGHRIELEEIEALLATHPQVTECALGTAGTGATALRLLGWIVGTGVSSPEVLAWLTQRLPAHMIPGRLQVLPRLPRTITGKLDRQSLAASEQRQDDTEARTPSYAADGRSEKSRWTKILISLFEQLLGPTAASADADFFASGGHSLLAIQLTDELVSQLGQAFPVQAIFDHRTPNALAAVLARRARGEAEPATESIDLPAEAQLDESVRPGTRRGAHPPRDVLLTGATGFLGIHLLAELLERTEARVHCLVRARDRAAAEQRLQDILRRYSLEPGSAADRIVVLPGDLAAPRLGQQPADWERLGNCVDLVLHNGAAVDFLQGYRALEGPNVDGTRSVLALAATAGAAVHFVSTIGLLTAPGVLGRDSLDEHVPLADMAGLEGGYEQTKWVSEALVQEAGRRGLPVAVHRPGRIVGSTLTGHWAADDMAGRFLVGALQLGVWADLHEPIDLSPVDWVAASIVHLALARPPTGDNWHLLQPTPTAPELFSRAAERRGHAVRRVSPDEWVQLAHATARDDPSHPLHLMLPLLPVRTGSPLTEAELVPDGLLSAIETDITQRALADGPGCPVVNETLVDRWLGILASDGRIAVPESPP